MDSRLQPSPRPRLRVFFALVLWLVVGAFAFAANRTFPASSPNRPAPKPGEASASVAAAIPFPAILYATEGAKRLLSYNTKGNVDWEYPVEVSRDISVLPNGNILFAYNNNYAAGERKTSGGAIEVTLEGRIVSEFKTTGQVFSCCRLPDGTTLVGAASQGKILFVDAKGKVIKDFRVRNWPGHSCMRHVRTTPEGNILVAEESARAVREYTPAGVVVREIRVPFTPFSVQRLPNGNTLVSGQTGLVEVDAQGKTVWELKNTDFPDLGIRWCAGFEVLENGDLLVCNAGGTTPLFRVARESPSRIVWRCAKPLPLGHAFCSRPAE